ncbi:FG-GAP repeat domain-containing protein [Streptomyces tanashiensis]|uniref:FG-GAP repeat domain-containing protein n=1 Tax=Streptomyces tanashiensis TaxID=67367 RepID=UPI00167E93BC|nr:VCBS repeat-containing protein [Streptomyces tanashiensis]
MRTALSRRRVPMSVAVVLAVVASGPFFAPAAAATPVAVTAPAATTTAPLQVPFLASGGQVIGAGTTGFLTRDADGVARWTRYSDGVSTVIDTTGGRVLGSASDSVVVTWPKLQRYGTEKAVVRDMATGAAPITFSAFDGEVTDAVGPALFDDGHALHPMLSTQQGGVTTSGRVTGMTDGSAGEFSVADSLPGTALGYYRALEPTGPRKLVVVDIATARVVQEFTAAAGATLGGAATITQDSVEWTEDLNGTTVLASAKRGSSEVTRVPLTADVPPRFLGALGGDWSVFGDRGATAEPRGVVARSQADGTAVKLLDHAESVMKAADGTLLAVGTTADRGAGVYRLSVADGKPTAGLIASSGQPGSTTPLTYTGHSVPATLGLDGVAKTRLGWKFSTTEADLSIELQRKGGGRFTTTVRPRETGTGVLPDGSLGFDWAGELGSGTYRSSAPAGEYEWTVTARPWNGMPAVTVSGTFTVIRSPQAHDYAGNGSPDLFARRANGDLDAIDTLWDDATGRLVVAQTRGSTVWTGDWNRYDRVEAVGDIAGSPAVDIVARDKAGSLWLHVGDPMATAEPVRIGGGWNTYTQLTGGSDLTGDGRADLVAVDTAGDLYLYTATGSTKAPFAPRKKIGYSWGIYNQLTATGNIGGGPAGDLVARDNDGKLWLYLGKGDGTFAPRTQIGGGWNVYTDIVGIGDANKDGRPDLYARSSTGTPAAYFYAGTGDWKVPFGPRTSTGVAVKDEGHETFYNGAF